MPAGFHIENFGCRAARADGEAIADTLTRSGLTPTPPPQAEVVVVNTCSVTAEADREARAWIRRAHRLNPEARIVVTGCYAQRAPQELASLPGVAAVIGNSHKALAPQIVTSLASAAPQPISDLVPLHTLAGPAIYADDRFAHSFLEETQILPGAQTRPNLKIQEGCGNRCTFCVIPQTRGNSRSLPEEKVLAQVRGFVDAGGNELVLSGINLGRWGRDLPESSCSSLAQLVRRIFAETPLPRLRLSSIEPMDWDHDLITLMREFGGARLARHAHLPLQSGSDSVLRRMHRRYRPWHYVEKVQALREAAGPALTLGADVMVGFPGETDREFQETYDFIRQLPFGYLHLFPFSPRPGTRGWDLHRQSPVPASAVDERMAALRQLGHQKSEKHRATFIGCTLPCITLNTPDALRQKNGTSLLSENFLPIELEGTLPSNSLISARITEIKPGGVLKAELVCDSRH
ncbi:tRNA (N(6)-L-threonylcarbamoyladenosine(37)-C(2))-methylthiotransferase MtaB [Occallatibacter riparius]|uniref:tRNA (N(6)-L-threonylcarbamoyladenosine(37)-C(2))-methylthiotransferase MtaB n=1 Tax=Occallatibacter riparius TaxID=1002689 RepID=A0A9J7BUR5_9BACT|nr:tRNA (N(6)-L-threonylcarbamoyladenosine(37)-C(2))-methylthiotransferase MtaB [Occallatibacter riparius]UWZ86407.1 tRNA (N(6)-L-threonylcarbamoyladenosine(37)-C(2))-methylthiotransferase MtaB [Occallatibacter riparius]